MTDLHLDVVPGLRTCPGKRGSLGSEEKYFLLSAASGLLISSGMKLFTDFAATVAALRRH